MTSYTTHLTKPEKNRTIQFPKLEGPILPIMATIQIPDVPVSTD
jgi:hypothetical protein